MACPCRPARAYHAVTVRASHPKYDLEHQQRTIPHAVADGAQRKA